MGIHGGSQEVGIAGDSLVLEERTSLYIRRDTVEVMMNLGVRVTVNGRRNPKIHYTGGITTLRYINRDPQSHPKSRGQTRSL